MLKFQMNFKNLTLLLALRFAKGERIYQNRIETGQSFQKKKPFYINSFVHKDNYKSLSTIVQFKIESKF